MAWTTIGVHENPEIPEGINTTKENHLKEFAILTGGVLGIVLVAVAILSLLANYLVSYIPIEFEI